MGSIAFYCWKPVDRMIGMQFTFLRDFQTCFIQIKIGIMKPRRKPGLMGGGITCRAAKCTVVRVLSMRWSISEVIRAITISGLRWGMTAGRMSMCCPISRRCSTRRGEALNIMGQEARFMYQTLGIQIH